MDSARIHWHLNRETRFPFGPVSPNPDKWESIGFPPPWPDRPWIFGVMVASANGVVAWRRQSPGDDPVLTILGVTPERPSERPERPSERPERIADRRHMRYLRSIGDAAVGAQTVREQPALVLTPQEPGDEPAPELYRFRVEHDLSEHPRNLVYSLLGRLPPEHPMFNTRGLDAIVMTTPAGAMTLERRGVVATVLVEPELPAAGGLREAHRRLHGEHDVRYLACEGGETILQALRSSGLLDEVFLTVTDVVIDERLHDDVLRIMDFEREGATLIAEGRISPTSGYTFRRWRFARR